MGFYSYFTRICSTVHVRNIPIIIYRLPHCDHVQWPENAALTHNGIKGEALCKLCGLLGVPILNNLSFISMIRFFTCPLNRNNQFKRKDPRST